MSGLGPGGPSAVITNMAVMGFDPSSREMYLEAVFPGVSPEQVLENNRREMKEALAKMASDLPGAKSVMIKGHSGRSIVQYAKDHEIDCIVMSSHQPGLEHFFLGSTADRVVRHATCAVHVIR